MASGAQASNGPSTLKAPLSMDDINLEEFDATGAPPQYSGLLPPIGKLSPSSFGSPNGPNETSIGQHSNFPEKTGEAIQGLQLPHIPNPPRIRKGKKGNSPMNSKKHGRSNDEDPFRKPMGVGDSLSAESAAIQRSRVDLERSQVEKLESKVLLARRTRHECDYLLLECWLNDLLTKTGPKNTDEGVELLQVSSASLSGLSNYGLSRAELVKAGLSPAAVERMYRALYVYTVGFHDTMKELFTHSEQRVGLVENVWKTFIAIAEKSLKANFKSEFLKTIQHNMDMASEVAVIRERMSSVSLANQELETALAQSQAGVAQSASLIKLYEEQVAKQTVALDAEQYSHSHIVQKYVAEVNHRTEVQEQLIEARAKLHSFSEDNEKYVKQIEALKTQEKVLEGQALKQHKLLADVRSQLSNDVQLKQELQLQLADAQKAMEKAIAEEAVAMQKLTEETRGKILLQTDLVQKKEIIARLEYQVVQIERNLKIAQDRVEEKTLRIGELEITVEELQRKLAALQKAHAEAKTDLSATREALARKRAKKRQYKDISQNGASQIDELTNQLAVSHADHDREKAAHLQSNAENAAMIEGLQKALCQENCQKGELGVGLATVMQSVWAEATARRYLRARLEEKRDELAKQIERHEYLIQKEKDLRGAAGILHQENEDLKKEIAVSQERVKNLEEIISGLQKDVERISDSAKEKEDTLSNEIERLLTELHATQVQVSQSEARVKTLDDSCFESQAEVNKLNDRIKELEKLLKEKELELTNVNSVLTAEVAAHQDTQQALEMQSSLFQQEQEAHETTRRQLSDSKLTSEEYDTERTNLRAALEKKRGKKKSWKAQKLEATALAEQLQVDKEGLQRDVEGHEADKVQLNEEIERLKQELADHKALSGEQSVEQAAEIARLQGELDQLQQQHDALTEEHAGTVGQLEAANEEIEQLKGAAVVLQKERDEAVEIRSILQGEIGALNTQIDGLKRKYQECQATLERTEQEMASTKDMLEEQILSLKEQMKAEAEEAARLLEEERAGRQADFDAMKLQANDSLKPLLQQMAELDMQMSRLKVAHQEELAKLIGSHANDLADKDAFHASKIEEKDQALSEAAASIKRLEEEFQKLSEEKEGQINELMKRLAHMRREKEAVETELNTTIEEKAAKERELQDVQQMCENVKAELEMLQAEMEKWKQQREAEKQWELEKDNEASDSKQRMEHRRFEVEAELQAAQGKIRLMEEQRDDDHAKIAKLEELIAEMKKKMEAERVQAQFKLGARTSVVAGRLEDKLSTLEQSLSQMNQEKEEVMSEVDLLKEQRRKQQEAEEKRKKEMEDYQKTSHAQTLWLRNLPPKEKKVVVFVKEKAVFAAKDVFNMDMELTPSVLLPMIGEIYKHKIAADNSDDTDSTETRQTLEEFVYDFFLFRFGLRQFAEAHLKDLIQSIGNYQAESPRIHLFGRLLGLYDELPAAATDFAMSFLASLHHFSGGPSEEEVKTGKCDIPMEVVMRAAEHVFKSLDAATQEGIRLRIKNFLPAGEKIVQLDMAMDAGVMAFEFAQKTEEEEISQLFHEADENKDGNLFLEEFQAIVQKTRPDVPMKKVRTMFREALRISGQGSRIHPEAFGAVMRANGFTKMPRTQPHQQFSGNDYSGMALLQESWNSIKGEVRELHVDLAGSIAMKAEIENMQTSIMELEEFLRNGTSPDSAWVLYRRIVTFFHGQKNMHETVRREGQAAKGVAAYSTKLDRREDIE